MSGGAAAQAGYISIRAALVPVLRRAWPSFDVQVHAGPCAGRDPHRTIGMNAMKLSQKILFLLAGWSLCAVAAARSPVVVDTYPPAKGAKAPRYSVDADARRLDGKQLGMALAAVAKDKKRGVDTPVAVLVDPALTINDLNAVARVVRQAGMKHVRYFQYQADRSMVAELVPGNPDGAFPRSRLESEVMAAPK
jgi:hypothetical protein